MQQLQQDRQEVGYLEEHEEVEATIPSDASTVMFEVQLQETWRGWDNDGSAV